MRSPAVSDMPIRGSFDSARLHSNPGEILFEYELKPQKKLHQFCIRCVTGVTRFLITLFKFINWINKIEMEKSSFPIHEFE